MEHCWYYVKRWIIVLMSLRSNWYLFSNERMIPTSMQGSKTQFFDVKKGPSPPLTQMMLILYNNRTILKAWAFLASIESIIYGRRTRDHKLSWSHSISFSTATSLEKETYKSRNLSSIHAISPQVTHPVYRVSQKNVLIEQNHNQNWVLWG